MWIKKIKEVTDLNPEHVLTVLYETYRTLNGISRAQFHFVISECERVGAERLARFHAAHTC